MGGITPEKFMYSEQKSTPVPLLLSYPRSGMNWFCYAAENATRRVFPGVIHIHEAAYRNSDCAVMRGHGIRGFPGSPYTTWPLSMTYDRMIFILRDFTDSWVRTPHPEYYPFYCDNIRAFDEFSGDKKLVLFDDLQKEETLYEIFDWAGWEYDPLEDINRLKHESLILYKDFHSYPTRPVTNAERATAQKCCLHFLGEELFRKYLHQWSMILGWEYKPYSKE